MAFSKLKAGLKLVDVIAQAGGRQLNRLGSKLGMDKDILEGMSENQVKGAILDEAQKYMRNKRKNVNRRVGAAAAGGAATYGVVDFVHDMLGISSVADGTLSAAERKGKSDTKPKAAKNGRKDTPPVPKPKPKRKLEKPKTLPKSKPKRESNGVEFRYEVVKKKSKGGSIDYRKGGMILSSVDNRKNK